MLPFDDLLEPADGVSDSHVLAVEAGELLGHEERLREKLLNLSRARHRELVLLGELIDAQNRDDVLQILVPLQDLLHGAGDAVVLVADDSRIQDAGRRRQRIDGGVDTELRNRAR